MRVVEVETQDHQKRYVVIDDAGRLVEPIARYLKYLDRINSARQTLRSYAYTLKLYWEYLTQQQLDWQHITLDDLSCFVLWLKLPSGSLKVLPAHPVTQARSNRTINSPPSQLEMEFAKDRWDAHNIPVFGTLLTAVTTISTLLWFLSVFVTSSKSTRSTSLPPEEPLRQSTVVCAS